MRFAPSCGGRSPPPAVIAQNISRPSASSRCRISFEASARLRSGRSSLPPVNRGLFFCEAVPSYYLWSSWPVSSLMTKAEQRLRVVVQDLVGVRLWQSQALDIGEGFLVIFVILQDRIVAAG